MTNESKLIDTVKRYIADKTYSYALLINGAWGSGKTFFVKNTLIKELMSSQNEKIKYVSLYGCESITDIEEHIVLEINEATKNAIEERLPLHSKKTKKRISAYSKEAIKLGVGHHFPFYAKLLHTFLQVEGDHYVFVFDDIERCSCSIGEILGLISSLVEQENTKVILVANEEEIEKKTKTEWKELQYFTVLNKEIDWGEENSKQALTPEVLEERRKVLFPDGILDKNYDRIKEKVIGVTVTFLTDFKTTANDIVKRSMILDRHKNIILSYLNQITQIVDDMQHLNYRTFQFFLSKVEPLLAIVEKMPIKEVNGKKLQEYVILDCLESSIIHKAGKDYSEGKNNQKNIGSHREFPSITTWVYEGYLDEEKLINEIQHFIERRSSVRVNREDVFWELYENWHLYSMNEVKEMVCMLFKNLNNNQYPTDFYWKILYMMVWLEKVGVIQGKCEEALAIMKSNIRTNISNEIINTRLIFISDSDQYKSVMSYVSVLNEEISRRKLEVEKEGLAKAFNKTEWANELYEYVESHKKDGEVNLCLGVYSSEKWAEMLLKAKPKEIDTFRKVVNNLYPNHVVFVPDDFSDIYLLVKVADKIKMEIDNVQDLISRQNLKWFIQQVDKIESSYLVFAQ